MTIAQTILSQLGGRMFTMMTGAKQFLDHGDALSFQIGRNSSRSNRVKITLTPDDLYTVEFGRYSPKNFEYRAVETIPGVYCDMLREIFTRHTGLDTSL